MLGCSVVTQVERDMLRSRAGEMRRKQNEEKYTRLSKLITNNLPMI